MTGFKRYIFSIFLIAAVFCLTTCDTPMGLGDPIDWEKPILKFDPVPKREVGLNTVLMGTVTDNVAVTRVVMREASTGREMFTATLLPNNRWEIPLAFNASQNGEEINVEIVAYDRIGNTDIIFISLIIDIQEPFVESIAIERASSKSMVYLEPYADLRLLETPANLALNPLYDALGERKENVNRYQNGFFTFTAKIDEQQTNITDVILRIYDTRYPNTPVITKERDHGTTAYYPKWTISEEEILDEGDAKFTNSTGAYENNYYAGQRYYYQVQVLAYDRAGNIGTLDGNPEIQTQNMKYFCMWADADKPKGLLDGIVGNTMYKKMTLPVLFFDDDQIDTAYAALLTKDQWNGKKASDGSTPVNLSNGQNLGAYATDQQKLEALRGWLTSDNPSLNRIGNWTSDPNFATPHSFVGQSTTDPDYYILPIDVGETDELVYYVKTGDKDNDYGDFVLFTLIKDIKLEPHTNLGPRETNQPRWNGSVKEINIIDDNLPMIVFDTVNTGAAGYDASTHIGGATIEVISAAQTGNSPDENTFPRLTEGKYFELNGFTLRENGTKGTPSGNSVTSITMAWIPYYLWDGSGNGANRLSADAQIKKVEEALSKGQYDHMADQIQYWELDLIPGTPQYLGIELGTPEASVPTGTPMLNKQVFRKRFYILGDTLDTAGKKGSVTRDYYHFTNPVSVGKLALDSEQGKEKTKATGFENEPKLFVFRIEDTMKKEVFRTVRLLPQRAPPDISVYDLSSTNTYKITLPSGMPLVDDYLASGDYNDPDYVTLRNTYNARTDVINPVGEKVYSDWNTSTRTGTALFGNLERAQPLRVYPKDSIVKLWVSAKRGGEIDIESITMEDVTYSGAPVPIGSWAQAFVASATVNTGDISYVERFPEVTQRVFKFSATDKLGNTAMLQRTISITNTASLNGITTTSLSGDYGIGKTITLKASFSGQISIPGIAQNGIITTPGTVKPELNIRYPLVNGTFRIQSIPLSRWDALGMYFDFKVPEGALGQLETMYNHSSMTGTYYYNTTDYPGSSSFSSDLNRPIRMRDGSRITDTMTGGEVFIPGYDDFPTWDVATGSLQAEKNIQLKGVYPIITSAAIGGKDPWSTTPRQYYFKAGETITLTLTSSSVIRNIGTPKLKYTIYQPNGTTVIGTPRTATSATVSTFEYKRSSGTQVVFEINVDDITMTTAEVPTTPPANTVNYRNNFEIKDITLDWQAANDIVDEYDNPVTRTPVTDIIQTHLGSTTRIFIDRQAPPLPGSAAKLGSQDLQAADLLWNTPPTLNIEGPSTVSEPWTVDIQYSTDGGATWPSFPTVSVPPFTNGAWNIRARYVDRAGNIGEYNERQITVNSLFPKLLSITAVDPSVTAASAYKAEKGSLTFRLNFEDSVRVQSAADTRITLADRTTVSVSGSATASPTVTGSVATNTVGYDSSYAVTANIRTANMGAAEFSTSITFTWNGIAANRWDMLNGLRVIALNLGGLRDRYGNAGPSTGINCDTSGAITIASNSSSATYDLSGIIVSTITPVITERTPANGADSTDNRQIILTFNKPVQSGKGTITVRPATASGRVYAVPSVFDNEGYYLQFSPTGELTTAGGGLDANGIEIKYTSSTVPASYSAGTNRTYVAGFYDIYNSIKELTTANMVPGTAARTVALQRADLIGGGTMSSPQLSNLTGLSMGPYLRTTNGLKAGAGYTGSYTSLGKNVPGPEGTNYMVPDTDTKWVLRYNIDNIYNTDSGSAISLIRNILTNAKFRWQEIPVNDTARIGISGSTVTITLPEHLLPGLQWEVYFPQGAFTDIAGNTAAGQGYAGAATAMNTSSDYWFWSKGVQKPVIRVDRKSYDARNPTTFPQGFLSNNPTTGTKPATRPAVGQPAAVWYRYPNEPANDNQRYGAVGEGPDKYVAAGHAGSIDSYLTIAYRIETETRGAAIHYASQSGSEAQNSALVGQWTGTKGGTTGGISWNGPKATGTSGGNPGQWILSNAIFRNPANNDTERSYNVMTTPNLAEAVANNAWLGGQFYGIRSFNKDATFSELSALVPSTSNGTQIVTVANGFVKTNQLEASKNYIVAQARRGTAQSVTAYEGAFRTVVAINLNNMVIHNNGGGNFTDSPLFLNGTNVRSQAPTIAGFPLRDQAANYDGRYTKAFYRDATVTPYDTTGTTNNRYIWVTTEIVSSFYMQTLGGVNYRGQQYQGDSGECMTGGYGDLTYAFNPGASSDPTAIN